MPPKKKKLKRKTNTHYVYIASCSDCVWNKKGKGAQGHAALHTDSTGHTTRVTIKGDITYSKL